MKENSCPLRPTSFFVFPHFPTKDFAFYGYKEVIRGEKESGIEKNV